MNDEVEGLLGLRIVGLDWHDDEPEEEWRLEALESSGLVDEGREVFGMLLVDLLPEPRS